MSAGYRGAQARSPEVALAVAVLERLFTDLRSKNVALRNRARADVADGGVQYWVGVVDGVFDVGEQVNQELRRLVA